MAIEVKIERGKSTTTTKTTINDRKEEATKNTTDFVCEILMIYTHIFNPILPSSVSETAKEKKKTTTGTHQPFVLEHHRHAQYTRTLSTTNIRNRMNDQNETTQFLILSKYRHKSH